MTKSPEIPWDKLATIACLTATCAPKHQFGRTALQKTVYLLSDVYDVDVGYEFHLHTSGPFCADLLGDLDFAESLGFVQTKRNEDIDWGFHIVPGSHPCDEIIDDEFRDKLMDGIHRLIEDFCDQSPANLEMFSTIVFVDRDLKRSGKSLPIEEFINLIGEIKPRAPRGQIQATIQNLRTKGHIGTELPSEFSLDERANQ